MTNSPWKLCLISALLTTGASVAAADRTAPPTPLQAVTDTYTDLTVQDNYRWLEQAGDAKVREWSQAQDQHTRQYVDQLPSRQPMFARLMAQVSAASAAYYDLQPAGGQIFALLNQPPKQQPMLAVLGPDADPAHARIVLDPNVLNSKGTTAIDWYVPSHDGKLIAVSMSDNGSEDGAVRVIDAASGKQVGPTVPRVQYPTGGGSLAWRADGGGFWYTRYPGPQEAAERQHFYQQVYFHKLGDDPAKDTYVLGKDFPKIASIVLSNKQNPRHVMVSVGNGDGGEYAHYVLEQDGMSRQISRFEDRIVAASIGPDDALYLVSRQDAPRGKLLKLALRGATLAQAKLLLPESDAVLLPGGEAATVTGRAIYVRQLVGGPSRVLILNPDGSPRGALPLPDVATVDELEATGDGALLYSVKTYLKPPYFARYDEAAGSAAPTRLAQTSPLDYGDAEVVREFATSKDGTRIPLNIVRRKGTKLDGSNPVLLNAYGGYNINLTPNFLSAATRLWLDAGGVFVIANLRGGGEYGATWHAQGALTNKQNVFDDYTAAAHYLIAQKYTSSARLAGIGGSNGGLLMGAVFTQHPELLRAVVSTVGLYDMLRFERDANGLFNSTEFGSVKDAAQRQALYAYSPYHHVVDGAKYPAIFMATGETDGRVNPMHSRKMIARLQAATGSERPVYLSINAHAGHGIGSALSIKVNQLADVYSFLFDQLGMTYPAN